VEGLRASERVGKVQLKARQNAPWAISKSGWVLVFVVSLAVIGNDRAAVMAQDSPQNVGSATKPLAGDSGKSLEELEQEIATSKLEDSEQRLREYLKNHPDSSQAHYDLGYVEFRAHRFGASITELSKSLELNPANAEAHKILALDCSIVGRYDMAEVELQQAARLKPQSAEIHYFLARTYYSRGVYPLAKSEFQEALRLDPNNIKAYNNLGITLEALNDTEGALANYEKAVRLDDQQKQKSEWPYLYLSGFYNRQRRANEALTYARKAMGVNPQSDAAYFEIAKAYRTQGELQKATDAIQKAIAINGKASDYYYVLGLLLHALGRQKESEQVLAKFAELQSGHAPADHVQQEPLVAEPN
jgi:tetratricopeptide (TPR) repeat protein